MRKNQIIFLIIAIAIILIIAILLNKKTKSELLLESLETPIPLKIEKSLMRDLFKREIVKDIKKWEGHPDYIWGYAPMHDDLHQYWLFHKKQVIGALIYTCNTKRISFRMYSEGNKPYVISKRSAGYIHKEICK